MRSGLLSFTLIALMVLVPGSALAAEATFFGPIVPPECNCEAVEGAGGQMFASAADWGCVIQTVQNTINFGVSISIIVLVIAIAYAGALFVFSVGNPRSREAGRQMVSNAFVGMLVVLSAWILVDFIMKVLYNPATEVAGQEFGPWNAILGNEGAPRCIEPSEPPPSLPPVTATPGGGGNTGAGGSCTVTSNQGNPCSPERLSTTCFGARAEDAARICYKESAGGNSRVESGSDRLINEPGRPSYSIGLWQINLTVHRVAGLNCPAAFSAPCQPGNGSLVGSSQPGACRSRITNRSLYEQCKDAAKVPTNNYAVACKLYSDPGPNGGFQPWIYSANRCNVSRR